MTLTPEKLDELERLANAAAEVLCYRVGEVRDYVLYESVLRDLVRELDPATVRELVRVARERDAQAARIAEREKPCVWTPEGEDSSSWNTGCGSSFWFDDGHEGVNFCPFCGHPAVFDHEGDEA